MKNRILIAVLAATFALNSVYANDAILDALVKKGVLNQQEANQIREQADRDLAQTTEMYNKVKVSSWVNSLQFFGDGRLRYEWRAGQGNFAGTGKQAVDNQDLNRFRYRLRFGVKGEFTDNFSYGLRLETGQKGNSSNSTMGPGLVGGPWNKATTDLIAVGQIWAQYKATDWLTLVGGKMENPFVNTLMVWDGDLNPEGFAEKFTFKTGNVDWFLNLGQFMYTANTANFFTGGAAAANDVWMFGVQAGGKWQINKSLSLQIAPTLYAYANAYDGGGGNYTPTLTGGNITGINDLMVFDVPVEFAFPIGKIPAKIFGDFATNLSGDQRARDAGFSQYTDQKYAYQVGLEIGAKKKKGDWQLKGYWQHQELFALDQNISDSDIFDSHLNMEGFVASGQYMPTDFLTLMVTYAHAAAIKNDLPTLYSAGDLKGNVRNYDLLQVDMVWKF